MSKSPGVVYYVTASALNGRTGPSTKHPVRKNRKGKPIVRNKGEKVTIAAEQGDWGRSVSGTWYALSHLTRKAPIGARPSSPVPGRWAGYPFGVKNNRYAAGRHTGVDYPASTGTPFVAVVSGRIARYIGGAYGKGLILRGDDGHEWLYAHADRRRYPPGKRVKRGQVIGWVGTTGNVSGPHLHLEKSRGSRWSYNDVIRPAW